MILRVAQILQTTNSITYQTTASFSFQKGSSSSNNFQINTKLLYPFEKDKTLEALRTLEESKNFRSLDLKNIITLDKLSSTYNSETTRAFDKNNKKFVAVKTIYLDTMSAWKQVNLTLRQHQKNDELLIPQRSILNYSYKDNEVKILTDIGRKTVNDWLQFRNERQLHFTTSDLKALLFQLLKEMNTQRELGAECNYLNPKEIFIEESKNSLRIFDFSGFEVDPNNPKWLFQGPTLNFDAALISLVRLIHPSMIINNVKDAKDYFKRNHPQFLVEAEQVEQKTKQLWSWYNTKYFEDVLKNEAELRLSSSLFDCDKFENLAANNYRSILSMQNTTNFQDETWGFINQGLGNYQLSVQIFNNLLEENIRNYGYVHEKTCESYLNLAEIYKSMSQESYALEYFRKAFNVSYNIPNMRPLLSARLYNEYGKLVYDKKQFKDAYDAFVKAQKSIKGTPDENSLLAQEIKNNLRWFEENPKDTSSYFSDHWKSQFDDYMKQFNSFREHMNTFNSESTNKFTGGMEQFASRMTDFGKRMEDFAKKMEYMGSYYKNYDWGSFHKGKDRHSYWNKHNEYWTDKNYSWRNGRGWNCHSYGHNWWSHCRNNNWWNCQRGYGSFHRPSGGFFAGIRTLFRVCFKVVWYSILIWCAVKIYKLMMYGTTASEKIKQIKEKKKQKWTARKQEWKEKKQEWKEKIDHWRCDRSKEKTQNLENQGGSQDNLTKSEEVQHNKQTQVQNLNIAPQMMKSEEKNKPSIEAEWENARKDWESKRLEVEARRKDWEERRKDWEKRRQEWEARRQEWKDRKRQEWKERREELRAERRSRQDAEENNKASREENLVKKREEIQTPKVQEQTQGNKSEEKPKENVSPVVLEKEKKNNGNWLLFSLVAIASTLGLSL